MERGGILISKSLNISELLPILPKWEVFLYLAQSVLE